MTDEQIEDLIEQSGGRWHEDEFRISAREIMDFARALLSASIADTAQCDGGKCGIGGYCNDCPALQAVCESVGSTKASIADTAGAIWG